MSPADAKVRSARFIVVLPYKEFALSIVTKSFMAPAELCILSSFKRAPKQSEAANGAESP